MAIQREQAALIQQAQKDQIQRQKLEDELKIKELNAAALKKQAQPVKVESPKQEHVETKNKVVPAEAKKKVDQPSRLDNFDEQFEDQFEKE